MAAGKTSNRLRRLRIAQGLSPEELAVELGVSVTSLARYEKGQTGIADEKKLRCAQIFGVTVAYLMGWDDGNGARIDHPAAEAETASGDCEADAA